MKIIAIFELIGSLHFDLTSAFSKFNIEFKDIDHVIDYFKPYLVKFDNHSLVIILVNKVVIITPSSSSVVDFDHKFDI